MATSNSSVVLSSLDFDTLKGNLKNYLKSQSVFRDYNFEGSNISVLLNVLAYNSFLNSFYLNMVGSEMFMDSAQLRDSIVSHAKDLNYTPRSNKSATTALNLFIPTSNAVTFVIPKGTPFSGKNNNGNYVFSTADTP